MGLLVLHITFTIASADLAEPNVLTDLSDLAERQARADIRRHYPGYAADRLCCLGIYHFPDTQRPHQERVMAAFAYQLIRAPSTA